MAIQFNCPYCTASIRVPDSTAGKRGKCPKCETLILIPQVERPEVDSAAVTRIDSQSPFEAPPSAEPSTADHGGAAVDADGPAVAVPMIETSQPLMASRVRQRRSRMSASMVVPMVFGAALIVVVLFWFRQPAATLEGKLSAVKLDTESVEPAVVPRSTIAVAENIRESVLTDLEREPQLLKSPKSMNVEFVGSSAGLEIHLYSVPTTQFFVVDPRTDEKLSRYLAEHTKAWNRVRSDVLRGASAEFFKEWYAIRQRDPRGVVKDLLKYRNEIGLSALVGAVGFQVEADVAGQRYRCVYEDDNRQLYFLLPAQTTRFTLRGREIAGSQPPFEASFLVELAAPQPAADEPKTADGAMQAASPDDN